MKEYLYKIFSGKKILILGLGREGLSTYKFIRRYFPKINLTFSDKKSLEVLSADFLNIFESDSNVKFNLGSKYLSDLSKYDLVIKTPGIPNKISEIKDAKQKGIKFISQTEIFLKFFRDRVIGITGTKGKSTTSSLIYHILKSNRIKTELLGNIGKPVLDYFSDASSVDYFVFEMSSHQLSDVSISPHVALFLNIFPEHLDYYEDFSDYFEAKANIMRYQNGSDYFVYSGKSPDIKNLAEKSIANKIDFEVIKLPNVQCNLIGTHNKDNIKAAFVVCREIGLSENQIIDAIKSFKPLSGRLESVGNFNGVEYINDTLATIPEATIEAINSYPNREITLILGGFDRGLNFDNLGKFVAGNKYITNIILIGQTAGRIKAAFVKNDCEDNFIELGTASMSEIVAKALEVTKPGGVVLLSPASTSFDMFKDYKDRGDQFAEAVRKLQNA